MKKLVIGLMILAVILTIIILFQQDKIKKIGKIKQGAAPSGELQTSPSDKRIDEIVAMAKKKQADQKMASQIVEELTGKFLIGCSDLADQQKCENLMQQIASDEKIILALQKLNKAGVGIIVTWYKPDKNQLIYINEYGSLVINEETDIQNIKKFFGLN